MIRQYVRFAEVYDKWMQNIDYTEWWQYLATTFSLHKGMRVLEVGCGTGSLTEHMLKAGLSVVASDMSNEMLTQAEVKLRGYSQCRLLRLDLRRLPLDLGKFDAIIAACDVVNYLRSTEELARFLAGARQLLKDDGALLFDVQGPGRITDWLRSPNNNRVGEKSCYM
ncbi:MAG: class I SAM-dependent methyltransferase [Bacillota bacterium]|nr:class I SAM-dependent methyltransferase [Bacillota bacterium]